MHGHVNVKFGKCYVFFLNFMFCCIPEQDNHPQRVTNTNCRTDTVISPDDGHIVARNM